MIDPLLNDAAVQLLVVIIEGCHLTRFLIHADVNVCHLCRFLRGGVFFRYLVECPLYLLKGLFVGFHYKHV